MADRRKKKVRQPGPIRRALQAGLRRLDAYLQPYRPEHGDGDWRDTLAKLLDHLRRRAWDNAKRLLTTCQEWLDGRTGSDAAPQTILSLRRHFIAGFGVVFGIVGGFGGWAATAELAGAVIASGNFVVESEIKRIQHPTGGIIGKIFVKNGDKVKAEQVVLRLDETKTRSNLAVVTKELDGLIGRRARLEAEHSGAETVVFPDEFLTRAETEPTVKKIVEGERRLFQDQRSARHSQKAQLTERIAQFKHEIKGLEAQKLAKEQQTASIKEETVGVEELYKKNLAPLTRLSTLRREGARLLGEHGQLVASMAETRGKIAETEFQIIQIDNDARAEALKELRDVEGKMGELAERKIAGEDELRRTDLRSPLDGTVHELTVHTVGGVVKAGETLMYIVPDTDALAVDVKVRPQDIDQISIGHEAIVRLSAFNQRTTPELKGTVTRVSAGITTDESTGTQHYVARVELAPGERQRLGDLKLVPGMPAEVHISTGERTALSYLLKPLTDQFNRAMREE